MLRWSILAFALFLMATNSNVMSGVLPEIARDLHASVGQVAVSITLYAPVIALTSPVVSIVVPAWSRTGLMAAGLVVALLGMIVAAPAPDLVTFTVGRVLAVLGGAALVPTATAAGAAIVGPESRGAAIAFVSCGFTLATAVGSPLGTAVAAASSWRVPLLGMVGLGFGLLISLLLLVRRVPVSPPIGLTQRLTVLRDPRILLLC
ncbi:MFS transporter [Microbacterium sp. 22303]|uniref:MFS transporter n=1 Tax=Microbacterium sp. 22303 TaxID=3453905 RepID=UPI003F87B38E